MKKEKSRELELQFRKLTQLVAGLIGEFSAAAGVHVVVVFDGFYLSPGVVKACRKRGFYFVSALKSNRNLYKGGKKLMAGTYRKILIKEKKLERLTITKARKKAVYRYVDAGCIGISKLDKLHVVYSRKNREPNHLGLVSDDPTMCAKDISTSYDARWSIEVFFKDEKQLLDFGQYQNRAYKAAVTHLHLVCFAYALLAHLAIEYNSAQEKRNKGVHIFDKDLQHFLRRIVWEDTAEYLRWLSSNNSIFKELLHVLVAT